jgi:hypothetical protein
MSAQHHFAPRDHRDRDLYVRERVLNSAIIAADIGRGWEEYLDGRERIRALLFNVLAPLHVMVEIGGFAIDVRESPSTERSDCCRSIEFPMGRRSRQSLRSDRSHNP